MCNSFWRLMIDKTLNFSDSFQYTFVAVLLTLSGYMDIQI
jgi:hypothetical protein